MKLIRDISIVCMALIFLFSMFYISGLDTGEYILVGSFMAFGILYVVSKHMIERPKKTPVGPGGEKVGAIYGEAPVLTEEQVLVEGFMNDVLDYCAGKGMNCTITNEPDGLWIVRVDDDSGMFDKLINLTMPDEKSVTKDNIKGILKRVCDEIDVKLNELDKKSK